MTSTLTPGRTPPEAPQDSRRRRIIGMGAWAVLFAVGTYFIGVPTSDPLIAFGWLWLATIAWRIDRPALEQWLGSLSVYEAVRRLAADTELLLMHAQGDDQVPWTVSEELHARARSERKRLLILPGGHHRSAQHDAELHGESLRFIERALGV